MELFLDNQLLGSNVVVTEWQSVEFACVPPDNLQGSFALRLAVNDQWLEPFLRPGDPAWRWRWNPQNAVGLFRLTLCLDQFDAQTEVLRVWLEVTPRKLDQQRYAWLLDDLQRVVYELIYAMRGGAVGVRLEAVDQRCELERLETFVHFLGERLDALDQAIARITRRPLTRLRPTVEVVAVGQARDFASTRDWCFARVEQAQDSMTEAGYVGAAVALTEVTQPRSAPTVDIYENRLLKQLLDALWRRAQRMMSLTTPEMLRMMGYSNAESGALRAQCEQALARLQVWRAAPFLAEVGSFVRFHGSTPVLQRDPAYRVVYRLWRDLRRYPFIAVESAHFHLPIKELPRLYEYWCAIQIVQALLNLPGGLLHEQHLIAPSTSDAHVLTFAVREEIPALILTWQGMTLRVRFQPRYRSVLQQTDDNVAQYTTLYSLDRHTRIPDIVIEVERPGRTIALIVFDAKYRLDAGGGAPEEALADAYTYLGSIGLAHGERVCRAVMLLYPGQGELEWYSGRVGAAPFLPGAVASLRAWLQAVLLTE